MTVSGGSLRYEARAGQVHITEWRGQAGEAEVPERIEGMPVVSLGKKAFLSRKRLRRVRLPDTVERIDDWAFAYCDNLERVELPGGELRFGRAVFLECGRLRSLEIRGRGQTAAALLAAAVTTLDAYYLLDVAEAGGAQWLARWDARMLALLRTPDQEGYSRQVLCGEEDYGSTDMAAYVSGRRREKVRLMLLRLLYPRGLDEEIRERMQNYLREHTKGCDSEEAWQVILGEHGEDREYYELFAGLGCVNGGNLEAILRDVGEDFPEMKAFFLRFKEEHIGYGDCLADLEL